MVNKHGTEYVPAKWRKMRQGFYMNKDALKSVGYIGCHNMFFKSVNCARGSSYFSIIILSTARLAMCSDNALPIIHFARYSDRLSLCGSA